MKTLISLFSIVLCLSYGKAQWVELDPGVDVPSFSDVYAITPDIVVVVGANGTILKTTDGGETWWQKPSGTTENLRKVQFPTPDIGYAVAAGDTFIKTTDGGETWLPIDVGSNCYFHSFSCVDENLIFATCSGNLIKSEDGGEVWNEIAPLTGGGEILFVNNEIGFAWDGFANFLSRTENGGQTWEEINGISPAVFIDENTGFYYSTGLYKSIDGGNDFEWLYYGGWADFVDIFAINENNVWGILGYLLDGDGSSRGIAKIASFDSEVYSETIILENNPEVDMLSIHFANENIGYIAGYKNGQGTIWKNGTGINTMGTDESIATNEIKVYPNPASSEINIEVEKGNLRDYMVSLTDMTGKQIYSKSFKEKKIKINTSHFQKGIYILSIETKNKKHSQKLIIN